jgi:hypothetical protein
MHGHCCDISYVEAIGMSQTYCPLTAEILNVQYDPLCRVIFRGIKYFSIIVDHEETRIDF